MAEEHTPEYYVHLGLKSTATQAEIRAAYRMLVQRYHPDKNPGNIDAEIRFKAITEAYAVLRDPKRRDAYDRSGVIDVPPSRPASRRQTFRDYVASNNIPVVMPMQFWHPPVRQDLTSQGYGDEVRISKFVLIVAACLTIAFCVAIGL